MCVCVCVDGRAAGRALVFANTKADVDALAASPELKSTARTIHGDVNQTQREVTLQGTQTAFACPPSDKGSIPRSVVHDSSSIHPLVQF